MKARGYSVGCVLVLSILAVLSFCIVAAVVFKGKGPTAGPALVLTCFAPLIAGVFICASDVTESLMVLMKSTTPASAEEMLTAFFYFSIPIWFSITVAIPTWSIGIIGACIRAFKAEK